MSRLFKVLAALVFAVAVSACQTLGGPNQMMGTMIGAGAGGLIGSQIGKGSGKVAAVGLGVLGGAVVGAEIGRSMDNQQRYGTPMPPYGYGHPPVYGYGYPYVPAPSYSLSQCEVFGAGSQTRADCVRNKAEAQTHVETVGVCNQHGWGSQFCAYKQRP